MKIRGCSGLLSMLLFNPIRLVESRCKLKLYAKYEEMSKGRTLTAVRHLELESPDPGSKINALLSNRAGCERRAGSLMIRNGNSEGNLISLQRQRYFSRVHEKSLDAELLFVGSFPLCLASRSQS